MIHDVTIPFSFDTSPIERQIASIGEREVLRIIREVTPQSGIYSVMPKKNGWYGNNTPKNDSEVDWNSYIKDHFDRWIAANSQEIVDKAALLLAMRGSRKKAWRDVLDELKAERDAEVSYDIRWCVETAVPNNDGDRYCVVRIPEYDSPTYNYRDMFVACMGWDYRQSVTDEDGNWHPCYYPMVDVVPKLERGLKELQEHPEKYRQYEPENGWGTLNGAVKCIKSWLYELDGDDNWDAMTNEWPIDALWWRW